MSQTQTILFPDISMFEETWSERPASKWAVSKIGTLQSHIEYFKATRFCRNGRFPAFKLIEIANNTFGFNGWNTEIIEVTVAHINEDKGKVSVQANAEVKVILKDGTNRIGSGIGKASNLPNKADALAKAKKEAIGEAVKDAIFGFEELILQHEEKVKTGFYKDGLFQ